MLKKIWIFLCFSFLGSACVSLQSLSLTPIPSERRSQVSSSVEKTIILGFNFNNDYVNYLSQSLQDQCSGGIIQGILTKTEIICYPLCIVYKKKISAVGYCKK